MSKLHSTQERLLNLLKKNSNNPLTIKDLMVEVGVESPGVLYHHINQLEKKGLLKRNPSNSRDYIVLDKPETGVVYVGKYGLAQCGSNGVLTEGNLDSHFPIASNLLRFSAADAFIVEAKGDSMEPKIFERDIVIAKKQAHADHGELIVCALNGMALIKKLVVLDSSFILVSLNQEKHAPININESDDFKVEGVVKNILSYQ